MFKKGKIYSSSITITKEDPFQSDSTLSNSLDNQKVTLWLKSHLTLDAQPEIQVLNGLKTFGLVRVVNKQVSVL